MATMLNTYQPQSMKVIHPLDDVQEQKCSTEGLGPIAMTRTARVSLGVLRAYLIAMTMVLGYHVLVLAGVFHGLK